ncbi:MAG TPA: hypothetical protein VGJ20_46740 [Xanthobacteraceae bacterium]
MSVAIAIGVTLECAKLTGVALLSQRHGGAGLRIVLAAMVATLMVVGDVSTYGLLSAANITTKVAGEAAADQKA